MPRAKGQLREDNPRCVVNVNFRDRSKENFPCSIFHQKLRNSTRQANRQIINTRGFKGKNVSENQFYFPFIKSMN